MESPVEVVDFRGPTLRTNLHTHTKFSDGAFPLAEVVAAYENLGYDALATGVQAPSPVDAGERPRERMQGSH